MLYIQYCEATILYAYFHLILSYLRTSRGFLRLRSNGMVRSVRSCEVYGLVMAS